MGRLPWILCFVLLGCSDDDGQPTGGGGDGTTSGTAAVTAASVAASSSSTGSSGQGGDAAGGGGSDGGGGEGGGALPGCTAEPQPGNHGRVAGASSTALTLSFATASFATSGNCTSQLCGPCRVSTCIQQLSPPQPSADAGTIALTGGDRDVQLLFAPNGTYDWASTYSTTETLFTGGDLVTFASTGGDVPAFIQTLEAPGELLVTAPSFDDLVVPLNRDFAVTWTGESVGMVEIALSGLNLPPPMVGSTSTTTVTCELPVEAGAGIVPATLLQALMPTNDGVVSVRATTSAKVTVGSWAIDVALRGGAAATNTMSGAAETGGVAFR